MSCRHLSGGTCGNPDAVAEQLTDKPSDAMCRACWRYDGPARGLGDVVHSVARATGVAAVVHAVAPDCGCAERRKSLNERFPAQAP